MQDSSPTKEVLVKEVQRKIGRNLMLYQSLEHMLKYFLDRTAVSVTLTQGVPVLRMENGAAPKDTMGPVARQFFKTFLRSSESVDTPFQWAQENQNESKLKISYSTQLDPEVHGRYEGLLRNLVEDRNELVHHLLPKWNADCVKSTGEIDHYLDVQREKALPAFEFMRILHEQMKDTLQIFQSPVCQSFFIYRGLVMDLLLSYTNKDSSIDGWVSVDAARNQLHQTAPGELAMLREKYNCGGLREYIEQCQLFDVREEPTAKGIRVMYRLKKGIHAEVELKTQSANGSRPAV